MTDLWLSGVFFQAVYTPKLAFCRGSARIPLGSLRHSLDPVVSWGGGHVALPILFTLRRLRHDISAFGASLVRPLTQIPGYAYERVGAHIAPTHRPI